jgi:hypothetical protein
MKRPYFQKKESANADFAIIENFWNLAETYDDFRKYKIETTVNGSTDVDYVIKYIDDLTDSSTTSTSGTITPDETPTGTITLEFESCQAFNGNVIFATVCIRYPWSSGYLSERHTIYSLDAGVSWTEIFNETTSTSFSVPEDSYPVFYLSANYYRAFARVLAADNFQVRFIRADLVVPASVQGPDITDVDAFYPGLVIDDAYEFVYVERLTLDVCIGSYIVSGGFTKKETLSGISAPVSYNNEKQIYWKKGNLEIIVDNTYLNQRYLDGDWSKKTATNGTTTVGIIFYFPNNDIDIAYIMWDNAIWEMTDKALKKVQVLEDPRDYKKVYLTNEPNTDNLDGVLQWVDENGNDKLSAVSSGGGAFQTLEIVDEEGGHDKVISALHNASSNSWLYRDIGTAVPSGTFVIAIKPKQTNIRFDVQISDVSNQFICRATFQTDSKIDFAGTTNDPDLLTYNINTWYLLEIVFVRNGSCTLTVNGDLLSTVTGRDLADADYLPRIEGTNCGYYTDTWGYLADGFVVGSNRKINAFVGFGIDIDEAWFATGDALTGIMQLSLKDYSTGSSRDELMREQYKVPRFRITRTTKPAEDEWLDVYTDAGQLFYGGKIKDYAFDNRFFWKYLMKSWEDEFSKTKIITDLIQYTYKEFWEYIIDTFSKYLWYGRGTNGLVNTFTSTQIDGTDTDWTNSDGASTLSSYVAKKVFLNGIYKDLMQQYDNSNPNFCRVDLDNQSFTVYSIHMASSDVTKRLDTIFNESSTTIGILRMDNSYLQWYDGIYNNIAAVVNDTMYHIVLAFNATDDEVDIYINGSPISTEDLANPLTSALDEIRWQTGSSDLGYYGYYTDLYINSSLIESFHTYSSISPLLTTKYNFKEKNQRFPKLMKKTAEETAYIVSIRPSGQVYIDQYAPNGITINANEDQGITFQTKPIQRNEKFSLITFYGGFIDGKQITSTEFGEPNFGSYERWYPSIQGQDPGDIYYDADGNPKSLRLDALVAQAISRRNIRYKTQIIGKRNVGLIYEGTYHTYSNTQYKISAETWYDWRKNKYFPKRDENRIEHTDTVLDPTDEDPDATETAQLEAKITVNEDDITSLEQVAGQIEEDVNDSDGQGITPAWGNVDSSTNFGANPNIDNFDTNLTNWITTDFANANSVKTYHATKLSKKFVLELMAGDSDEKMYKSFTISGSDVFFSAAIHAEAIDKDKRVWIGTSGAAQLAGIQMDSTGVWQVWRNGAWVTVSGYPIEIDTWYHVFGWYDGSNVKYWINNFLVYTNTTTDSGTAARLYLQSTENNDGNSWYVSAPYMGESLKDALSSLQDGSFQAKQIIADKFTGAIRCKDSLDFFLEQNTRNLDEQVWGLFDNLVTAGAVSSGSPQAATAGCHRILIVVIAGADVSGTITITGNTRDRSDTSNLTAADTEDIDITGLSTDNSSTDAQGNTIHAFDNVYMSDKWFEGSISISTSDVNISDMDVYAILYHQFDDFQSVFLTTLDTTFYITNTAAWFYSYLYLVECVNTNKKYNIENLASHDVTVGVSTANKGYRRRKKINQWLNGNIGHGVWLELFFGPAAATYFNHISMYLYYLFDGADPYIE